MPTVVSRLAIGMGAFGAASPPARATAEAFAAVALAIDAGVGAFDCPPDPDGAERILGQVLPRTVPGLRVTARTAAGEGGSAAVLRRVRASLRRLRLERVDTVLARPAQLLGDDGEQLWAGLRRLQDEGATAAIGIAACHCDDPLGLARRFRPDVMQLPVSLVDQRLLADGTLDALAARGVALQLRSIFSNGALFRGAEGSRTRRLLAEAGADPMQAALAFALGRPEAERVVVGVASAAELRAVVRAAASPGPALDWAAIAGEAACARDALRCRAA